MSEDDIPAEIFKGIYNFKIQLVLMYNILYLENIQYPSRRLVVT